MPAGVERGAPEQRCKPKGAQPGTALLPRSLREVPVPDRATRRLQDCGSLHCPTFAFSRRRRRSAGTQGWAYDAARGDAPWRCGGHERQPPRLNAGAQCARPGSDAAEATAAFLWRMPGSATNRSAPGIELFGDNQTPRWPPQDGQPLSALHLSGVHSHSPNDRAKRPEASGRRPLAKGPSSARG